MTIHCLQHVPFETPGSIAIWAAKNNHAIHYTYLFEENYRLPAANDFDMLLVMGGYMNVDEEEKFPWLRTEKALIQSAVEAGKKVLGICLGAQLIAAALGSRVYAGAAKEIGFFPLQFSDAALAHPLFSHFSNPYPVFHWHGDTFGLPAGVLLLASTPACAHQGYLINNRVLGLQFHFEMTEPVIEAMLHHDGHELEETGPYIQTAENIRQGYRYLPQNQKDIFLLLDKFAAEK
jgi:GMP synthase-like glutamine amidotransferase